MSKILFREGNVFGNSIAFGRVFKKTAYDFLYHNKQKLKIFYNKDEIIQHDKSIYIIIDNLELLNDIIYFNFENSNVFHSKQASYIRKCLRSNYNFEKNIKSKKIFPTYAIRDAAYYSDLRCLLSFGTDGWNLSETRIDDNEFILLTDFFYTIGGFKKTSNQKTKKNLTRRNVKI